MSRDTGIFNMRIGETLVHSYDTTANVTGLEASLSTGVWSLTSGISASLLSQTTDGNNINATINATSKGMTYFECLATYADGQATKAKMTIHVRG